MTMTSTLHLQISHIRVALHHILQYAPSEMGSCVKWWLIKTMGNFKLSGVTNERWWSTRGSNYGGLTDKILIFYRSD